MNHDPEMLRSRRADAARRQRTVLRRRLLAVVGLLLIVVAVTVVVASGGNDDRGKKKQAATPTSGGGDANKDGGDSSKPAKVATGPVPPQTAAEVKAVRKLASYGLPIYCAGRRGNRIALTFDDGPGPYTHLALKKLRQAHMRATFFLTSRLFSIKEFRALVPKELKYGTLADHSVTHPLLTQLSNDAMRHEIIGAQEAISKAGGGLEIVLFRPPYGGRNAAVDAVAKERGMAEIIWDIDSLDSQGANYAGISHNVRAGLKPGAIILMHENRGQTIRALATILPSIKRRHLKAVTLTELLTKDPPSLAQLKKGPAGC